MLQGIRRRLTFSNVVALLAVFIALGSSSLAEPVRNGAQQLIRARDLAAGVAATDVLGTARLGRGARGAAVGKAPVGASQASGICNSVGQVVLFSGNFLPRGTAAARGQLLPINQNQLLFAMYGTTFGGNGTTTFGLPDLRGAEPKGQGDQPVGYFVCLEGNFPQ
jgi:Phage Tail Collar Domain